MKPASFMTPGAVLALVCLPAILQAQFTAINYQGRLIQNGQPAEGYVDIKFSLYNSDTFGTQLGASVTNLNVTVSGGALNTYFDFGPGVFNGLPAWLEIGVRPAGTAGAFEALVPRQPLTPTPEALHAQSASSVSANTITTDNLALAAVTGSRLANGAAVRSLNGLKDSVILQGIGGISVNTTGNVITLSGQTSSFNGWNLSGNSGTSANNFLGTTDSQPLEVRVNGLRALRLSATQNNSVNVLAGSDGNQITAGSGVTIAGGGGSGAGQSASADFASIGGGAANSVQSAYGTVSGGLKNVIKGTGSPFGFIGGGATNTIDSAGNAVIVGGVSNKIDLSAEFATIVGGQNNLIGNSARNAVVMGGWQNSVGPNSQFGISLGGFNNVVGANALYAAVLGGSNNRALAPHSFAMGRNAVAQNIGSYVWADSKNGDFPSTRIDEFSARATGGVRFVTAINGSTFEPTAGVTLAPGATAWAVISDRESKKNFAEVDVASVLDRVSRLPVLAWNYRWESDRETPHLGPMAQDFKAAFYPGRDDHNITTLEMDGVTLAAIQGLNRKLEKELRSQTDEINELRKVNEELMRRLESLERRVQ